MKESVKGTIALFFSYIAWGLHPLYWKLLQHVSSMEILMHRVLWSVVFGVALVTMQRHWGAFRAFLRRDKKGLAWLAAGGFSVALNWFLFIWAVNHGRILETSLAYFINPLVSMLFGYLFFSERMRPLQKAAIALAFSGVAMQCWIVGSIPFVSLGIALSFAIYGAIKKKVSVDPGVGLLIETAFVAPIALLYLIYAQRSGVAAYPYTAGTNLLLAGGGVIAAIPLVLFSFGTQRVPLSTVGFMQFLSPSITFAIGTLVYAEPLNRARFFTFAIIWLALLIYILDAVRNRSAGK